MHPTARWWRTPDGTFLIERNLAPVPFVEGGVGLRDGGPRYDDCAEYYEVDARGGDGTGAASAAVVVRKFGAPIPFSIEDEMTVSRIHRVIGDSLYEFYWSQRYRHPGEMQVTLRIAGLVPAAPGGGAADPPFDADALCRAYDAAEAARLRRR